MGRLILNDAAPEAGASDRDLLDAARAARDGDAAARERLPALAAALDPPAGRPAALAFWIHVYNALVIHGALALSVRRSVKEVPRFFRRCAYRIRGLPFTPDDIEHGVLRANRGHPARPFLPAFLPLDRRRSFVLRPPDPRIHFALHCGGASCPPIRHYEPERLDAQLETAARAFVQGGGVGIAPDGRLLLSPLFRWYRRDFGRTRRERITRILAWAAPEERVQLEAAAGRGLRYTAYDWSLA